MIEDRGKGCYLYDGTGNPWAGHSSVIAPPSAILNACKSANDENFGRVLATGSRGDTKKDMTKNASVDAKKSRVSYRVLFQLYGFFDTEPRFDPRTPPTDQS